MKRATVEGKSVRPKYYIGNFRKKYVEHGKYHNGLFTNETRFKMFRF